VDFVRGDAEQFGNLVGTGDLAKIYAIGADGIDLPLLDIR